MGSSFSWLIAGEVDQKNAVIIVSTFRDASVTVRLRINNINNTNKVITQDVQKNVPSRFLFQKLTPNTTYKVDVIDVNNIGTATKLDYATVKTSIDRDLAVISCDYAQLRAGSDMWKSIADNDDIGFVLHGGDNIYADEIFWRVVNTLDTLPDPKNLCKSMHKSLMI